MTRDGGFGARGSALALVLAGRGAQAGREGALAAAALLGAEPGKLLRAGLEGMAATGAVLQTAAQAEGPAIERQRPSPGPPGTPLRRAVREALAEMAP